MTKATAKKICIVVSSLGGGGAERSSALLSELLFDLGYNVHVVSVLDKIDYPYKGQLLNLGKIKSESDTILGRLKRLMIFKNYLKEHNFDYIIDNRTRIGLKELIISKLIYNPKHTIYFVRSYNTALYVNPKKFLGKYLYNSAYKIVCVSKEIAAKLKVDYGFKNLEVLYNPTNIKAYSSEGLNNDNEKYILFYGRLDDEVKNISLLLKAFSKSKLPLANIKLKILGDGKDKESLINMSKHLQLESKVDFLEFQNNPNAIVASAYFIVLTSRYEGFPRVLIESLALGTPVVSVDCKSGPKEIVINEHNGLLIKNHDETILANAMNRMVEDKDLYLQCKSNAKSSVEKFSKDVIAQQWNVLLK